MFTSRRPRPVHLGRIGIKHRGCDRLVAEDALHEPHVHALLEQQVAVDAATDAACSPPPRRSRPTWPPCIDARTAAAHPSARARGRRPSGAAARQAPRSTPEARVQLRAHRTIRSLSPFPRCAAPPVAPRSSADMLPPEQGDSCRAGRVVEQAPQRGSRALARARAAARVLRGERHRRGARFAAGCGRGLPIGLTSTSRRRSAHLPNSLSAERARISSRPPGRAPPSAKKSRITSVVNETRCRRAPPWPARPAAAGALVPLYVSRARSACSS